MLDLLCLPAMGPGHTTFGTPPAAVAGFAGARVRALRFPRLVWYNAAVRAEAARMIAALDGGPLTLVGFSKSGLGAWHLARELPGRVAATIVFDAPVARLAVPPWETAAFYPDDGAWQHDLPLLGIDAFRRGVAPGHRLVLVSGANFHDEMATLASALAAAGVAHVFLPRPDLPHHWGSGWLPLALAALRDGPRPAA